jgi:hypothetical protein
MEMPRVGMDFAGYQVQGIIGRGGMSVVYQAEHPRLARVVALKVLALELAEDDRFRERFVRESRLAASLDHPNIVPIYDAGAHEDLLYIAMRYVKGDLKTVIQREGRLRPDRLMPVITQVASALDAAHHLGLVHRDVKPANVLIAFASGPDGQDHVYLADFGLTKHATSRSGITGTGQFVGTVDYMAPEQIEGKQVDGRVDVYALGCIVYECLTGRVPFARDTDAAVIWAHLKDDPPKASAVAPSVPVEVDDVIAKAMGKSADDRYSSCMEFLTDLRQAVALDPLRASRASIAASPPSPETVMRERPAAGVDQPPGPPFAAPAPAPPAAAAGAAASMASSGAPPAAETPPVGSAAPPGQVSEGLHDGLSAPATPLGPTTLPPREEARPASSPQPAIAPQAPPVETPAGRERRRSYVGAIAVVALLAVVGAALWLTLGDGGLGGGGGEQAGGAVTSSSLVAATTTDLRPVGNFPDLAESLFLVPHIGADNIVAWNCRRPETLLEGAIRAVECSPGQGVRAVTFSLFHDGFSVRNYFANQSRAAATTGGGGECFSGDSWRGTWSIGPDTWTHAIGPDNGQYKGQVFCYRDNIGQPHISWIDYATKIYADATGERRGEGALYDWWLQEAGPGHPENIHDLEGHGGAEVVQSENVVTGSVVDVGQQGTRITSATLEAETGQRREVYFDPEVEYECALSHLDEHQQSGALITVPVERSGGRVVATHFTHC